VVEKRRRRSTRIVREEKREVMDMGFVDTHGVGASSLSRVGQGQWERSAYR